MRFSTLLFGAIGICAAQGAVVPATHIVHEKRHAPPAKWVKRDRIQSKAILPMRIGLRQENLDKGHEYLMDVSDPSSPNYAKHWTSDEVIKMFAPSEKTVEAVRQWLIASGISPDRITHTDNQGWLAFDATAEEAESLLHAEYHEYEHNPTGSIAAACDAYHVPKHIQEHVDYITPGLKLLAGTTKKRGFGMSGKYGKPKPPNRRPRHQHPPPGDLKHCDVTITPDCIAALYQIPAGTKADPSNAMGIFEEGDFYSQDDLNLFFQNFTPQIPQGTHPKPAFIDGAQAPVPVDEAGGESDLDFELAYPILWPQNTVLFQTDDINYATGVIYSDGGFNTFLDAIDGSYCTYSAYGETGDDPKHDPIYPDTQPNGYKGKHQCGVYKPTNVISVSYGGQENELPAYYQKRQCNEFLKLGLKGHSILYASGDSGVAGDVGTTSNTNGCLGAKADIFNPAWPNTCPYITNVGATKVYPGHTVYEPESAVVDPAGDPYLSAYSSGGGFSNIYPVPDYQQSAVSEYFKQHNPPYKYYVAKGDGSIPTTGGVYSRYGRGYPDVAANGDNIATYNEGEATLEGGTSASTPIFASVVNRINEERISIGKSTVGFINPTLYSNPWVLNDITNGSNPGCGTNGFSAVKGYKFKLTRA